MTAWSRVVDGRRLKVNCSTDIRWSGSRSQGDAVSLAVDGSARDGRPADRIEARMIKTKHVSAAHADILVGFEVDVDVAQFCGTRKGLRDERVCRHWIS